MNIVKSQYNASSGHGRPVQLNAGQMVRSTRITAQVPQFSGSFQEFKRSPALPFVVMWSALSILTAGGIVYKIHSDRAARDAERAQRENAQLKRSPANESYR